MVCYVALDKGATLLKKRTASGAVLEAALRATRLEIKQESEHIIMAK
jgi:hypothetical protein